MATTGNTFNTLDLTIGQVQNLAPQGQAETGVNAGISLTTADTGIVLNSGGVIKGGQTAFNTGNGFFLGYTGAQYKVSIGDPSGQHITWDGSNVVISANTGTFAGNLVVSGDLTVNGTTTTLNTQNLQVEDKNIILNYGTGDTSASVNGAGITIQDAVNSSTDATILWDASTDTFDFSHPVDITGNIVVSGTVDGRDVATDGTKLDGIEASADVTDATNVTAAGALMDSELTSIASVKALNQGVATTDSPTFAGLTTTANVSFGDNDKAVFGAGSDLQIYHDGSNSRIHDTGTGNLILRGSHFKIEDAEGFDFLSAIDEGDGGTVRLFHDASEKLKTKSTGIDVTGVIITDGMTTSADINFGDNDKAVFGAGSDLQIYHDGSHSYIEDAAGTGNLKLRTNTLRIENAAGSELSATFVEDGAVTLYNDNTARLATTSTGIDVTGVITTDGLTTSADINFGDDDKAVFGAGTDLEIFHESSTGRSFIKETGSDEFRILGSDIRIKNGGDSKTFMQMTDGGSVAIRHNDATKFETSSSGINVTGTAVTDGLTVDGSATITTADNTTQLTLKSTDDDAAVGPRMDFSRRTASPADNDLTGQMRFRADNDAAELTNYAIISSSIVDASDGTEDGGLEIFTKVAGTDRSRVKFNSTGATFNDDQQDLDFRIASDDSSHLFFADAQLDQVNIGGSVNYSSKLAVITDDNSINLSLVSTDEDSNIGPKLSLRRDSASPANSDSLGRIQFTGDNNAGQNTIFGQITAILEDVTDGAEDGTLDVNTIVDGTSRSRLKIRSTESVFNEGSQNIDFRVESDGNTNMLFVDAENDRIGVGTNSPDSMLHVSGGGNEKIILEQSSAPRQNYIGINTGDNLEIAADEDNLGSGSSIRFRVDASEKARITENGHFISGSDGGSDLGKSDTRWQNLYLSGGAYIGGTGSSNYLDDYEEGTFTFTLHDASSGGNASSTTSTGDYTKVGRLVTLSIRVRNNVSTTGMTANNTLHFDLPFTSSSNNRSTGSVVTSQVDFSTGRIGVAPVISAGAARGSFQTIQNGGDRGSLKVSALTDGVSDFHSLTIQYIT